ncbi:hypothetical protein D1BOALGB6SA_2032 [Olavius sp. associated proteobacterium Delta 1]|nr:hypothetical protein D1BOALGB6SA_2032 [Olavius sp. associated proteobacterium Delta 1]
MDDMRVSYPLCQVEREISKSQIKFAFRQFTKLNKYLNFARILINNQ